MRFGYFLTKKESVLEKQITISVLFTELSTSQKGNQDQNPRVPGVLGGSRDDCYQVSLSELSTT